MTGDREKRCLLRGLLVSVWRGTWKAFCEDRYDIVDGARLRWEYVVFIQRCLPVSIDHGHQIINLYAGWDAHLIIIKCFSETREQRESCFPTHAIVE